jgi:hypothetical protein
LEYLEEMERKRTKATLPDTPAKPESISSTETQHWLREFAELVHDPKWQEELGPDFKDADRGMQPKQIR